ncbi:MAG TPA: efflux RND transporter periplasmic adaptor subunit [Planctomycetota bacterium]|nr:efflux RND transporter periplasmic adaptor subunit [Planctomycetota bacterium]
MSASTRAALLLLGLLAAGGLGWAVLGRRADSPRSAAASGSETPVPVEAAPVSRGPLERRRTFSGTLEASAQFLVAPKVGGRVQEIHVDLGDVVRRDQVVALLDDAEFVQAVAQAEADLAIARARVREAESALKLAERERDRVRALRADGVASEAEVDVVAAQVLARGAALEVAVAQRTRAESALELARIRLSYTRVRASWGGPDGERHVAERLVDEGETVTANTPLLSIVGLRPITAVVFVTERDYGGLKRGQPVRAATDAYPGRTFPGRIERIAPVFRQGSRQARVEIAVDNPELRLKPGMFVRVEIVVDRADDAVTVPRAAIVRRAGRTGVFLVDEGGRTVSWRPVEVGIDDGERVQILGAVLSGRVVTLGHHLLEQGSRIVLPGAGSGP